MTPVDIGKLDAIINKESKTPTENVLYRDTFAVACYLHKQGQYIASYKLCQTLFNQLGQDRRITYYSKIIATLKGNEVAYGRAICAHVEVDCILTPLP